MWPLRYYLADCIQEKLVTPAKPDPEIFWSRGMAEKFGAADPGAAACILPDRDDLVIGTYRRLSQLRRSINQSHQRGWAETQIHHIVENYHLQFLGVVRPVDQYTYDHCEPCLLMPTLDHTLYIENAVGGAVELAMERRGFDFIRAFTDQHFGISQQGRTRQGQLRAAWVKAQERLRPPPVTRGEIRGALLEIYDLAYHDEYEYRPLHSIARRVIEGMPL